MEENSESDGSFSVSIRYTPAHYYAAVCGPIAVVGCLIAMACVKIIMLIRLFK